MCSACRAMVSTSGSTSSISRTTCAPTAFPAPVGVASTSMTLVTPDTPGVSGAKASQVSRVADPRVVAECAPHTICCVRKARRRAPVRSSAASSQASKTSVRGRRTVRGSELASISAVSPASSRRA